MTEAIAKEDSECERCHAFVCKGDFYEYVRSQNLAGSGKWVDRKCWQYYNGKEGTAISKSCYSFRTVNQI